ncbi:MAG: DUF3093 domain-containing protein [Nocardioidaceae bacterium]
MSDAHTDYRETLRVPLSWWLLGAGFIIAVWWAFYVATPWPVSVIAGVAAAVVVVPTMLRYGGVRLNVGPQHFRVGVATLPLQYVGEVEALDKQATRRMLGAEADARAYLVVRAYCSGAVKVSVEDAADPAPYWLVSTRRPEQLAQALSRRRVQD